MILPPAHDDAGVRALALIRHQLSGDHEALRRELAFARQPPQVDIRWLEEAWAETLRQAGELHAVEEPELRLRDDLCLVVEVPLHFARGEFSERVTFDAQGRVAAVALLPQSLPG